jgi:hypothetical protein
MPSSELLRLIWRSVGVSFITFFFRYLFSALISRRFSSSLLSDCSLPLIALFSLTSARVPLAFARKFPAFCCPREPCFFAYSVSPFVIETQKVDPNFWQLSRSRARPKGERLSAEASG